jgi:hypothetical protein
MPRPYEPEIPPATVPDSEDVRCSVTHRTARLPEVRTHEHRKSSKLDLQSSNRGNDDGWIGAVGGRHQFATKQ